ncbi:MAG: cytochrome c [Caulobacteraceae bacterium]
MDRASGVSGALARPGRRAGLLAGLAVVLALTAAGPVLAQSDGRWRSGEQAYAKTCAYCHESGVGPVLKGRSLPPSYIAQMARHGFRQMPAFPPSFIDDKTLADLGDFLKASPAPAATATKKP